MVQNKHKACQQQCLEETTSLTSHVW